MPKYLMNRRDRRLLVRHDTSVMTYRGHTVLQTLIRCRFSPAHTTGQRYIYTGCATGSVVSEFFFFFFFFFTLRKNYGGKAGDKVEELPKPN